MTPKEKAKELVEKYFDTCHKSSDLELSWKVCKKCALIAVDEIMKAVGWEKMELGVDRDNYWTEVKQEIEKV
jgi:hypothetical protein